LRILSQAKMVASSLVQVKNPLLVWGSLPITKTSSRGGSVQLPRLDLGTASKTKTMSFQRTGLGLGSVLRMDAAQVQGQSQLQRQGLRQSQLQRQGLRQSQLIRQDVVQRSELITPVRTVFAVPPPPPPPPMIPRLKGGILEGYGRNEFKSFFVSFKPKYVASVEAVVFNIRGKANLFNAFTGIGLRPIRLGG